MRYYTKQNFIITGINPEPWTASEASTGRLRSGSFHTTFHKSAALTAYQEAIKESVQHDYPEMRPVSEPCSVTFFFWRNLPTYEGARGKKVQKHHADATNMQKALEDALQGILYENDHQVDHTESWIMAQGPEVEPLIVIEFEVNRQLPTHWMPVDKLNPSLELPGLVPEKARHVPVDIF